MGLPLVRGDESDRPRLVNIKLPSAPRERG